jgi:ABC-type multidrug transport system fused ATPase/permease subunit
VNGDRRSDYSQLPAWLERLSYESFVQLLMASLVLVFVIKNAFVLASGYVQQRIQFAITNRLVQRLFETYLRQPYEFHLVNSSSVLVRNVQDYSGAVVGYGVAPIVTIITDIATGTALLSVLVVVQPVSTVVLLAVFALCGYAIVALSRSRTRKWGTERVKHRGIMMEMLLGGLGGIKEIQLFGRDRQVVETHRASLYQAAKSFYLFNVLQSVPRAAFEVVAVVGVSALVVVSTIRDTSLQDTTLIVALFGVVAFRMLPSVNRIIQASQQFSYGRTALEGAVLSLALPNNPIEKPHRSALDPLRELRVVNLKYRYPNTESVVVNIDSLFIRSGESLGIIGESGSGKSTLVDLLIGILNPQSGTVSVNGRDIAVDRRYWQDRIGYVPQHVYLMDTTIRRNVAFGLPEKVINDEEVVKALRSANLWEFVCGLPNGLNTVVGERGVRLSGGQRQRLGIARALYGNPEVIVLDEATSALDTETEREIVESLREIAHDHTLIVVAHRTSTLAHCSRLIRLEKGRIVQEGTFEEVIGSLPDASDRGQ